MRKTIMNAGAAVVCIAIGVIFVATFATTATNEVDDPNQEVQAAGITPQPMAHLLPAKTADSTEPTESPATEPEIPAPDQNDVEMLAKLIWGEARGVQSKTERAAVVWCVLNRVDATGYACGGDIEWVITFPSQFQGYDEDYPATSENIDLAIDVLMRWYMEKAGYIDTGRVLPEEYLYFHGDGKHNYFTTEYRGTDYYSWSLETPYEN